MHRERLQTLADYLSGTGKFKGKGVPRDKFDLHVFMGSYAATAGTIERNVFGVTAAVRRFRKAAKAAFDGGKPAFKVGGEFAPDRLAYRSSRKVRLMQPVKCQTAGCACGWATTIPEFKKAGLCLVQDPLVGNQQTANLALVRDGKVAALGYDAAAQFFDIATWHAAELFDPEEYLVRQRSNPLAVAKRIRDFIAEEKVREQANELLAQAAEKRP